MMKQNNSEEKKRIRLEIALLVSFITLLVGFVGGVVFSALVGGVVFSAFKMEDPTPATSDTMLSDKVDTEVMLTEDQQERIEALEQAAADAPENTDNWIALGNACFDNNLFEKAINAYEAALKQKPGNADVWTDLGVMYRRSNDPENAIAAFEKAQEVSPGHQISLLNIGIVRLYDLNDPKNALIAWEKLLEFDPEAVASGGMPIRDLVDSLKSQP
jgi:cytochrome c-type biogenesis protein CcmH/NrfG